jgi:YrbI family 3-deoxy-D-manno-octulosonate 8-phosphate phosphatase
VVDINNQQIIAIILARGGSKGIPGKNIMDFCGKPLLAWSILQAKNSQYINQVYVSSDDALILDVATQFGAIIIRRPEYLASDTASSEQALLHALNTIAESTNSTPDLVVFLQATSPLRTSDDIDRAILKICETEADSLFSMAILDDYCIWAENEFGPKGLSFDPANRGRRQDRQKLYLENGSIYIFRPNILKTNYNRLGGKIAMFEMPFWKSYEIDKMEDVELCTYYFQLKLLPYWSTHDSLKKISVADLSLIVYDFDGVMTDNRVIVLQDGTEAIVANRADGLGISRISSFGIPQLILTTETNPVVQARASKLKLQVIGGCKDKVNSLREYCDRNGYDLQGVVFVGNDINDLEAMKIVGYPVAPDDAHPEVKAVARLITQAKGGAGVIKELSERIVY